MHETDEEKRNVNALEANKLLLKIQRLKSDTTDGDEISRLKLEDDIMTYYIAYSNFDIPFGMWIVNYLKDILGDQ